MIDVMPRSKAGRAVACSATLIVAVGVAVFTLRDTPNKDSVGLPHAGVVPPAEISVDLVERARLEPVVEPVPNVFVENPPGAAADVWADLGDGRLDETNSGYVIDTGSFIDADDDAGDYSFSPVSHIGEFLDPDAE